MTYRKTLLVASLFALAATLLMIPAEVEACRWFDGLFGCGRQPTTVMYAPAASSGCAPCGTQTVQYMPRTTYRPFYARVPVTYYYPTAWTAQAPMTGTFGASCSPCGFSSAGCATCPTGTSGTIMSAPLQTPSVTPAPNTFKEETPQPQTLQRPIEPVPEPSVTRFTPSIPRLMTPENGQRIRATMRVVRPAVHVQTVSRAPRPVGPIDDGGWRASRD